jgi:hypothetical protein
LQPYDLLRHERLVLSKDAAVRLGETLGPRDAAHAPDVVQIEGAEQPAAPKKAKPAAKKKAPAAKKAAKKPAAKKKGKGKK